MIKMIIIEKLTIMTNLILPLDAGDNTCLSGDEQLDYELINQMIKMNNLLDAGDYTCWSGDQQSESAKLTVHAPPGVPHIRSDE